MLALSPSSTAAKERLIMQRACLLPLAACSFTSAGGEELCKEPFPGDGGRVSAPCTNLPAQRAEFGACFDLTLLGWIRVACLKC